MTLNYETQFKTLADQLALQHIAEPTLERRVLRHLWTIDDDTGKLARHNRERTIERVLAIFRGRGSAGDTTGNSPGSKWVAFNAIAEHLDYGRRYTARTNQVQRSFEDVALKQRALARGSFRLGQATATVPSAIGRRGRSTQSPCQPPAFRMPAEPAGAPHSATGTSRC
jgi:hypothetical protein